MEWRPTDNIYQDIAVTGKLSLSAVARTEFDLHTENSGRRFITLRNLDVFPLAALRSHDVTGLFAKVIIH